MHVAVGGVAVGGCVRFDGSLVALGAGGCCLFAFEVLECVVVFEAVLSAGFFDAVAAVCCAECVGVGGFGLLCGGVRGGVGCAF